MYTTLAKYYDAFMDSVDYDGWIDYVCSFLRERKSGVDLACGSGKFTLGLIRRGYETYGADISVQMLSCAKENARKSGIRAEFLLGDMETFEFLRPPEFVTAMCDAVNYLKNPRKAFENIYSSLKAGGVFVFDISTEYKLTKILGNNTYSDTRGDITYIWNNFLRPKSAAVDMELTFFERTDAGLYRKSVETQTQYVHKTGDLKAMLESTGFGKVSAYSGTSRTPARGNAERVHFIAYK